MNLRRKEALTNIAEGLFPYSETFLMWMICSGLMGLAGGAVGAVFYHMVSWANRVRAAHSELLWLLPGHCGGVSAVRHEHRAGHQPGD